MPRACPCCGESIQDAAVLCRFCKADLRTAAAPPPAASPPSKAPIVLIVVIVAAVLCVPGVAIVAAIAIPGLLAAQRTANERTASAQLRLIALAEKDFRANDRDENRTLDYWVKDVRGLHSIQVNGREIRLIERDLADADPTGPATVVAKRGYLFAAIPLDENGSAYDDGTGRHGTRFAFCAWPESYRRAGRMTFIIDERGAVWQSDTRGARVDQWPTATELRGWSRAN